MMKILHSGTLDIKYGGPALSTYLTIKGLQANQVNAEMLMAPLTNKKDLIANDVKNIILHLLWKLALDTFHI